MNLRNRRKLYELLPLSAEFPFLSPSTPIRISGGYFAENRGLFASFACLCVFAASRQSMWLQSPSRTQSRLRCRCVLDNIGVFRCNIPHSWVILPVPKSLLRSWGLRSGEGPRDDCLPRTWPIPQGTMRSWVGHPPGLSTTIHNLADRREAPARHRSGLHLVIWEGVATTPQCIGDRFFRRPITLDACWYMTFRRVSPRESRQERRKSTPVEMNSTRS